MWHVAKINQVPYDIFGIIRCHKDLTMIKILGVDYLTRKEAAHRYGLSVSWFEQRQQRKEQPNFIKIRGKGKAFYPLVQTDEWFKQNLLENE